MSNDTNVIRSISWRDLCPWLSLFRGFTLALNPNIILLAFAGLILTFIAWFISDTLFLKGVRDHINAVDQTVQLESLQRVIDSNVSPFRRATTGPFDGIADPGEAMGLGSSKGMPGVFWDYADSFHYMFHYEASQSLTLGNRLALFAYFLLGGLATIAIWSVLAGAITRIAIMRLGREEGCGLTEAVKFSLERFVAYFSGPVLPMAFVLVLGLIVGLFCLLMLLDWGVVLVGIFWILVLIVGFLMAFLLIGLLFGWPLMWPTISAENSDAFDAISRCYAYVLQRPLNYVFYVFVSIVFGAFCWWIVTLFGEQVIAMSDWAASWGANARGGDRIGAVHASIGDGATALTAQSNSAGDATSAAPGSTLKTGARIIAFWNGLLRTLVAAYAYGLFWCLASAVYLLMRKDVDETEFDEVYVEGEDDYGLPPLTSEPGAPRPTATETTSSTVTASTSDESEDVATVSSREMEEKKDGPEKDDSPKNDADESEK